MNAIAPQHMHKHAGPYCPSSFTFDGLAAPFDPRAIQDPSALPADSGSVAQQSTDLKPGQRNVEGTEGRRPQKEAGQTQTHGHSTHGYPKLVVTNERPQSHDRGHQSVNRAAQSGSISFTPSDYAFFAALFLLSFSVVLRWEFIKGLLVSFLF